MWKLVRIWILSSWSFLTIGILLGSWWAYHELGWGGWWFWDPVENASLMPWLLATACIHSITKPKLNYWTLICAQATFIMSILGTFFVRSGLLSSVHSFATDSTRGLYLLFFLLSIIAVSLLNWKNKWQEAPRSWPSRFFFQAHTCPSYSAKQRAPSGRPEGPRPAEGGKGDPGRGPSPYPDAAAASSSPFSGNAASLGLRQALTRSPCTGWGPCRRQPAQGEARAARQKGGKQAGLGAFLGRATVKSFFARSVNLVWPISGPKAAEYGRSPLSVHRQGGAIALMKRSLEQILLLQNCYLCVICLVVFCGTAAPLLFQWFWNRDVGTGAPFYNGTLIPLFTSVFFLLLYVHYIQFTITNKESITRTSKAPLLAILESKKMNSYPERNNFAVRRPLRYKNQARRGYKSRIDRQRAPYGASQNAKGTVRNFTNFNFSSFGAKRLLLCSFGTTFSLFKFLFGTPKFLFGTCIFFFFAHIILGVLIIGFNAMHSIYASICFLLINMACCTTSVSATMSPSTRAWSQLFNFLPPGGPPPLLPGGALLPPPPSGVAPTIGVHPSPYRREVPPLGQDPVGEGGEGGREGGARSALPALAPLRGHGPNLMKAFGPALRRQQRGANLGPGHFLSNIFLLILLFCGACRLKSQAAIPPFWARGPKWEQLSDISSLASRHLAAHPQTTPYTVLRVAKTSSNSQQRTLRRPSKGRPKQRVPINKLIPLRAKLFGGRPLDGRCASKEGPFRQLIAPKMKGRRIFFLTVNFGGKQEMNIAHTGIVFFIVGILLSNTFKFEFTEQLHSGPLGAVRLGSQICCLRSIDHSFAPTFHSICANLLVFQQSNTAHWYQNLFGKPAGYGQSSQSLSENPLALEDTLISSPLRSGPVCMFPEKRFYYSNQGAIATKVAIHSNLFTDFYSLIGTGSIETGWFTTIMKLPFIFCIWLGFMLGVIGGLMSLKKELQKSKLYWI